MSEKCGSRAVDGTRTAGSQRQSQVQLMAQSARAGSTPPWWSTGRVHPGHAQAGQKASAPRLLSARVGVHPITAGPHRGWSVPAPPAGGVHPHRRWWSEQGGGCQVGSIPITQSAQGLSAAGGGQGGGGPPPSWWPCQNKAGASRLGGVHSPSSSAVSIQGWPGAGRCQRARRGLGPHQRWQSARGSIPICSRWWSVQAEGPSRLSRSQHRAHYPRPSRSIRPDFELSTSGLHQGDISF